MDAVIKVLQDLSDHLACRRCIRLDIGKLCLTDCLLADPVMVKHHDRTGLRKKRRALRIARAVGVNNHQNRIWPDRLIRLSRRNDHVRRISFFRRKAIPERFQRSRHLSEYDMRFLSDLACRAVNTDRCTKGIDIRHRMAHDVDTVTRHHQLTQRLRLYPCLYSGGFFRVLSVAAKIADLITCLDDRLVAASAECKIHCRAGILIILDIVVPDISESHT